MDVPNVTKNFLHLVIPETEEIRNLTILSLIQTVGHPAVCHNIKCKLITTQLLMTEKSKRILNVNLEYDIPFC